VKKKSSSEEGVSKRRKSTPRRKDLPRVPAPVYDIQINCCRNPGYENFGVPPLKVVGRGPLSLTNPRVTDGCQLRHAEPQKDGSTKKLMGCGKCGPLFYLKSNQAVWEELDLGQRHVPRCPLSPARPGSFWSRFFLQTRRLTAAGNLGVSRRVTAMFPNFSKRLARRGEGFFFTRRPGPPRWRRWPWAPPRRRGRRPGPCPGGRRRRCRRALRSRPSPGPPRWPCRWRLR